MDALNRAEVFAVAYKVFACRFMITDKVIFILASYLHFTSSATVITLSGRFRHDKSRQIPLFQQRPKALNCRLNYEIKFLFGDF